MIGDWVEKVGYYSAIRKDEMLPFVATRIDLENVMLGEMSQTEKAKNRMISLICGIYNWNSQTQTAVWWLPEGKGVSGGGKE